MRYALYQGNRFFRTGRPTDAAAETTLPIYPGDIISFRIVYRRELTDVAAFLTACAFRFIYLSQHLRFEHKRHLKPDRTSHGKTRL